MITYLCMIALLASGVINAVAVIYFTGRQYWPQALAALRYRP